MKRIQVAVLRKMRGFRFTSSGYFEVKVGGGAWVLDHISRVPRALRRPDKDQ